MLLSDSSLHRASFAPSVGKQFLMRFLNLLVPMENTTLHITEYLDTIVETCPLTIEREVALWLREEHDPMASLKRFLTYGCASRMVPFLVYYTDARVFFDQYYRQINQLYQTSDIHIPKTSNLRHWLACFAFETVASEMYFALELSDPAS